MAKVLENTVMTGAQINRRSKAIFLNAIPSHWIYRDQEDQEDYGIDGEVEISTDEDRATGFIFKVQLKGTQEIDVDSKGNPRFRGASVERFSYYINSLSIPTIFIVCDITTQLCYWIQLQGNKPLERAFKAAHEAGQQTFTIILSKSQITSREQTDILPILDAIELSKDLITLRDFKKVRQSAVYEDILTSSNPEELGEKHQDAASYAKLATINKKIKNEQYEEAYAEAQSQFDNKGIDVQFRIAAGGEMVRAYSLGKSGQSATSEMNDANSFKYAVGIEMLRLVKNLRNDHYLKAYALVYARAARLRIIASRFYAIAQSEADQEHYPHSMSAPFLRLQRMELGSVALHEMMMAHKRIIKTLHQENYKILAQAWVEYAQASTLVIGAYQNLNKSDLADSYTEAVLEIFPICLASLKLEKIHQVASSCVAAMAVSYIGLFRLTSKEIFSERVEALKVMVKKFSYLDDFLKLEEQIEGMIQYAQRKPSNFEPTPEQLADHIRERAYELGFELDNPNDRFAEAVRIGLDDLDPTRVLKNCVHMCCVHEGGGMPAEMLGLPSAGMKKVVCLKFGHGVGSLKLDDAYDAFSKKSFFSNSDRYCDACDAKEPHPPEWQYTFKWGDAQHQKYLGMRKTQKTDSEISH